MQQIDLIQNDLDTKSTLLEEREQEIEELKKGKAKQDELHTMLKTLSS